MPKDQGLMSWKELAPGMYILGLGTRLNSKQVIGSPISLCLTKKSVLSVVSVILCVLSLPMKRMKKDILFVI